MQLHTLTEAVGIVSQWVTLYLSGRAMNLFKMSMFQLNQHWEKPSVVLSRAIFFHFLFGVLDGTYWQGAWTAKYIHHPWEEWLFHNGIVSNIPFRHIGPSIVAYLHLYAKALEQHLTMEKYHREIILVIIIATLHTIYISP